MTPIAVLPRGRPAMGKEAPVRLQVKGKNVEVSESLHRYAEEKLGKLDRHLNETTRLELELAVEKNPSIVGQPGRRGDGLDEGPDPARSGELGRHEGVDRPPRREARAPGEALPGEALPEAAREAHAAHPAEEEVPSLAAEPAEPVIVKTKQFAVKPMTPEEAVLQLELIGHDFFCFRNVESNDVNVVYRRRDRNYGLIEPASWE